MIRSGRIVPLAGEDERGTSGGAHRDLFRHIDVVLEAIRTPFAAQIAHNVVEMGYPGGGQAEGQTVIRAEDVHGDGATERVAHTADPIGIYFGTDMEVVDAASNVVGHFADD